MLLRSKFALMLELNLPHSTNSQYSSYSSQSVDMEMKTEKQKTVHTRAQQIDNQSIIKHRKIGHKKAAPESRCCFVKHYGKYILLT